MLKSHLLHLPFHADALIRSLPHLFRRFVSYTQFVKEAVYGIRRVRPVHEAFHVFCRPELATRVIQPCYHQGSEQVIVGGLHLVIADAVEQCSVDEFRPNQPKLALAQTCKYLVVRYCFVIELEKRHACLMLFYPSVSSLDEQTDLFGVTATAYNLDALPLPMHLLDYAHRGTTRFILLLLDKHATKIAFLLHTESVNVEKYGG